MNGPTITPERAEEFLFALNEQLDARGARLELVVIGGAALGILGLVRRPTRDVDVVALRRDDALVLAQPLPEALQGSVERVAADFGLPEKWLNADASEDLLRLGLPGGFESRLVTRSYGSALIVHFADRYDQVHLKLYAMVDQGVGKHEDDLRALAPTSAELLAAARWTRTHDPSEGFKDELLRVLRYMGVPDADVD